MEDFCVKSFIAMIVIVSMTLVLVACAGPAAAPEYVRAVPVTPADSDRVPEVPDDQPYGSGVVSGEHVTIGILQIAAHLALDAAREGFISGLADLGWVEGDNLTFIPFNAHGDISNAHAMAAMIVESEPDLILGIATATSQALANATETIPIVITAVTNPLLAGLVESFDRPNTNVTGTSDLTPVASQFELMQRILPDVQTVGIIFNAGEINAQIQVDWAMDKARELGLYYETITVASTADVAQAVEAIIGRVDVIYAPTCNTLAAAMSTVAMIADENGIPIIGGEESHVFLGALATEGINYYRLGRQASTMAAQILRGEAIPQEMPIQWQEDLNVVVNISAAERLGITIPEEILSIAEIFEE